MTAPEPDERPLVTTEPQRQALDEMSRDLLRKLNAMVEEQNERARQFASTEHSLSSKPMEFHIELPGTPDTSTIGSGGAISAPQQQPPSPPSTRTAKRAHTPPPPQLPPFPNSAPAAEEQAAQRRAEIMKRQREQRRAEQEAEEQRRERIRQAQESADSIGSLMEFLGLNKPKTAADAPAQSPTPRNNSAETTPQPAHTPSCGCTTLFIVIAVILIILKVIASLA